MKPTTLLLILIYSTLTACSTVGSLNTKLKHIEANAHAALNAHEDIRSQSHVNITSANGIVLVSGEAPSVELSKKIINTIRAIPGIKLIHNHLKISVPSSETARATDALITKKVKTALAKVRNLSGFNANQVKVATENKTIYLMGRLHRRDANIVTEMARRVEGVQKVVKLFELIP